MSGELRGKRPTVGSAKKRAEAPSHWQTLMARRDYNQEFWWKPERPLPERAATAQAFIGQ